MNKLSFEALPCVALLGLFVNSPPFRKSLQPAAQTTGSATARVILMSLCTWGLLAVQADGYDERPGLRIIEVVDALEGHASAAEVRLGIDTSVIRPGVQVPARQTQINARETEIVRDPPARQRVLEADLAELGVRAVFHVLSRRTAEA